MEYLFTILSVMVGSGISLYGVYLSENRKEKREKRKEKLEEESIDLTGRKKLFYILEDLNQKCKNFLKEDMGYGDPLNLENIPTFELINNEKILQIKFFLNTKYKNKYKDFIAIENSLDELRQRYDTHNYEFGRGIQCPNDREDGYRELSDSIYDEMKKIIENIETLKEKI